MTCAKIIFLWTEMIKELFSKMEYTQEIQMVDLYGQHQRIEQEINDAIAEVIQSARFINGPQVYIFAQNLAKYLNVKHVIPCGNGTDALQIALMSLDLQPGDEVVVPVHTYVATAEAIALLKLTPVFVDVDPDTFNMDTEELMSVVSESTKAIVPVHLYGQCANMKEILAIANKYNISIIEDTAQAIGVDYVFSDKEICKAGTIGDLGTISFFPSKNLGCFGDGGAIVTNNDELAEKCRLIANHGQRVKYQHDIVGCNSRLDTIQAAILDVKLSYLDSYVVARQQVADIYDKYLESVQGIQIPCRTEYSTHAFHQYTIKLTKGRDEVKKRLAKKGIPAMIYYPIPLHLQKAYYQENVGRGAFPVTELLSTTVLSLPIHTEMKPDAQDYIIKNLTKIVEQVNG